MKSKIHEHKKNKLLCVSNKITLITLLLFASLSQAQEKSKQSYSFSLEQAIGHALQNSYATINATRDIEKAKKKKWETTATGLPQINGGVDYLYNIKIQKQVIPADAFPITDPNQPQPQPGDVFVTEFGTKQSLGARATLSQLIFDGSYLVALKASKTYLQYYENYKVKSDNDVREMVTNAYGNVLLAEESIRILNQNKTTLEKTLNDTRETFKNGLIEEENVEQLQITLASVNSNINNTTRLLDVAYKFLKINLGVDLSDDLTLTDKLDDLTKNNLDLALTQTGFSLENNADYQIGVNFKEQRRLEYQLERSKLLPTLSASVNYGTNAYGDKRFDFFQSDKRWFDYSNVGVSLSVPIFSSFGKTARIQQAKISYAQAETQLTETSQRLQLQYEQAKSEYEFSIEEYGTAKSNLNLAERIEKKQQVKFTEGLSTSFDFAEAQRQLYSAQQSYLQSMVDIINKKAALEKVMNNK